MSQLFILRLLSQLTTSNHLPLSLYTFRRPRYGILSSCIVLAVSPISAPVASLPSPDYWYSTFPRTLPEGLNPQRQYVYRYW